MATPLSNMQAEIVGKTEAQVKELLGFPIKVSRWQNMRPPEGADAAALAAFEDTLLDQIWIYSTGRVHFNAKGKALQVDDDVSRDLPPSGGGLVA